jgi:hypothetical protein
MWRKLENFVNINLKNQMVLQNNKREKLKLKIKIKTCA